MEQPVQKRMQISNELLDNMLAGVKSQDDLWGQNGIITQLSKVLLERILQSEMDFHLQDEHLGRSINGHTKKKVRGSFGEFELSTLRDRHSTFEPQIVPIYPCTQKALFLAIFSRHYLNYIVSMSHLR